MNLLRLSLVFGATLGLAACGGADIGETCDTSGATGECVDGAICTNNPSGSGFTCRKLCTDQVECAATEACNGIARSNQKSCQPQ